MVCFVFCRLGTVFPIAQIYKWGSVCWSQATESNIWHETSENKEAVPKVRG